MAERDDLTPVRDTLGAAMATFGPPAEGGTCRGCGQEFAHLPKGTTDQLCRGCTEVADEADRLLAQADRLVEVELMDAGLEDRERGATVDRIPPEIRRRLPPTIVRGMVAGELPERGFGLSGTSGIGKTMALSAIVKQYAMARLQRIARAGEFKRARGWLAWVPWKATTETVRALSMEERGHAEVNRLMERYARAEVLVLDDLGAERIRGNYADDWATSQLDRIVDLRDRKMLPLWYTSNLDAAALQKFYGSRLWSRLCGIAPLVELGSGPDLRLRRESADVGERPKNR